MLQVNVNFRLDEDEVSVDPFYSENNIQYLERKMEDYKAGRLSFTEHEMIED